MKRQDFAYQLPRGLKLAPEYLWERRAYVLSVKLKDPQFSGQTKERLSSCECAVFVCGVVHDAFSLYLNSNTQIGDAIAELAISAAQRRLKSRKQVAQKKVTVQSHCCYACQRGCRRRTAMHEVRRNRAILTRILTFGSDVALI